MIYEFVGLPATGKTTSAYNLQSDAGFKRALVQNKFEILFWFFIGVLFHPIKTIQGFYLLLKYRINLYVFWNYFIIRYSRVYKAEFLAKNEDIWIIDEPPLQNIYSLMASDHSLDDIEYIYSLLYSPYVKVHFSLDEEERFLRRKKRGRNMKNEFNKEWRERTVYADTFLKQKLNYNKNIFVKDLMMEELKEMLLQYAT